MVTTCLITFDTPALERLMQHIIDCRMYVCSYELPGITWHDMGTVIILSIRVTATAESLPVADCRRPDASLLQSQIGHCTGYMSIENTMHASRQTIRAGTKSACKPCWFDPEPGLNPNSQTTQCRHPIQNPLQADHSVPMEGTFRLTRQGWCATRVS